MINTRDLLCLRGRRLTSHRSLAPTQTKISTRRRVLKCRSHRAAEAWLNHRVWASRTIPSRLPTPLCNLIAQIERSGCWTNRHFRTHSSYSGPHLQLPVFLAGQAKASRAPNWRSSAVTTVIAMEVVVLRQIQIGSPQAHIYNDRFRATLSQVFRLTGAGPIRKWDQRTSLMLMPPTRTYPTWTRCKVPCKSRSSNRTSRLIPWKDNNCLRRPSIYLLWRVILIPVERRY